MTAERMRSSEIASVFAKNKTPLMRFIRSQVSDLETAEDIVQDVFYQLLRSPDLGEVLEDAGAWLFRVARNRVIDWYRKRKAVPMSAVAENSLRSSDTSSVGVTQEAIWEKMVAALEELPPIHRDVFVLHELEGKSFKEIQEITGVNQNTLLARKRRAVLHLRKRLKQHYAELSIQD